MTTELTNDEVNADFNKRSRAPFKSSAITDATRKAWEETRTAVLYQAPAFTHIFYTMLVQHEDQDLLAVFTEEIPIAATDGVALYLHPVEFFKFSLHERVFVICHEVLHCVFNHMGLNHVYGKAGQITYPDGKSLPWIPELANIAEDFVINALLVESNIGKMPSVGLYDRNVATGDDAAVDIYRKLYEGAKKRRGDPTEGYKGKGFDKHLAPGRGKGQDPNKAAADRQEDQQEWDCTVESAMESAKAQGKLPAALDRMFTEVLAPKPRWQDKVQAFFARRVGSGDYSWRRPDRRLIVRDIYYPGRVSHGCGTIVVGGDTSGSIGPKTVDMFLAEIGGILEELRPERLVLIWCDAAVNRVDYLEDVQDINVVRHKGAPGGGGTDFRPVFDWVTQEGIEPDALIYLTDGYGSFPDKPSVYPVLWGNIVPNAKHYPWGEVVDIPPQAD